MSDKRENLIRAIVARQHAEKQLQAKPTNRRLQALRRIASQQETAARLAYFGHEVSYYRGGMTEAIAKQLMELEGEAAQRRREGQRS